MAYKSLFSVLTDEKLAGPVLSQAVTLTGMNDAHLEVLCMGVDRSQTGYYYAGANAMILQESITRAQEEAEGIEARVRDILRSSEVRWSTESGVAQLADLGRHVAARARFSDMVVLPRPYGEGRGVELEPILEAAMFEGHTPVLVVPDEETQVKKADKIVLAWNESAEALNAARAALPMLIAAESVHLAVIDPPTHGPDRSDPGGLLSQYLARHGVKCEIDVLSKTMPRVSDVLLRHCKDIEADLVVMGAYGKSRFREAILGGATRYMLEQTEIPVFMAH
ncbi:universal stress protein [Lutimaribacter sp. EGI FJ00015]|uniref:Universal stress protein n=1 Tax=Lutimaribacter degradans TaxID=2945989 RepID=A0ACC5ZYC5_9RHOB|nr:universal stress protein [Lutimaribacter sp. EGI FJ00013]MCM2562761.1 universal stress protein [Lutimaribacter sp. EGI FJ00013]MCO0613918.1 universal stress protein [Lutimaribacter sp. EGI FJ00015]MCO0636890.1 universal stress protein [Lutimaribacter sp. EGI FJ00014]